MSAKTTVILGLRVIALTVVLFLCYLVASAVSGVSALPADVEPPTVDAGAALLALLVVSLSETFVFAYIKGATETRQKTATQTPMAA